MSKAHATLSASGAKRWMNCPGSIRMSQGIRGKSSEFAQLGTAAHALAEACLVQDLYDASSYEGFWINASTEEIIVDRPRDWGNSEPPGWFLVDGDMIGAVNVYLEAVQTELKRLGKMTAINVEKRFDLGWLRPEMFGTNDCSLVAPYVELVVMDYKHGQGVLVEVENNEQMLYYALGAAHEEGWDFEKVTLILVQPRASHPDGPVRRWSIPIEKLKEFANKLARAADATREPNAPLKAGDWCRFCPANAICPEIADRAFEVALDDFDEVKETDATTPEDELGRRMKAIPLLDAFIKGVEAEVTRRLKAGEKVSGYKLVRKKSNRAWDGEEKDVLEAVAQEMGLPLEAFQKEVKYLGPAGVEKLRPDGLKPKDVKALVAKYTTRPPGGITVAPEDDPREMVDVSTAAEADFDEFSEEGED